MWSTAGFLPQAVAGLARNSGAHTIKASATRGQSRAHLTRRALITLLPLLTLQTTRAATRQAPLSDSLTRLIVLRNTLHTLSEEIETGTNADIRRVVKTLLIGCEVPKHVREAVAYLPKARREEVIAAGREAYEYLNQVVEYYDPVDVRGRARGPVLAFCLSAVKEAGSALDAVVDAFGEDGAAIKRALDDVE